MTNKLGVNFDICFPEETRQTLGEYLRGINKPDLLKMSSFFLGFNSDRSEFSDTKEFLKMFFSYRNIKFASIIFENIQNYARDSGRPLEMFEIPYIKSSLSLFEFVFDKIPDEQLTTKTKEEIEQDVFKAYVSLNQITITEFETDRHVLDYARPRKLSAAETMLANSFHNNDLINFRNDKLFHSQLLRAFYYFEFLSDQEECEFLLKSFYEYYEVEGYHEYLRRLLGVTYPVLMKDHEAHTEIHIEDPDHATFIDKHIIEYGAEITELDFINVRSNPLYKFEEFKYRIIYPLFVIEMIYNGLFFRLKAVNETLPEDLKVKQLYNLKTLQFSEQFVLSKILEEIYGNRYIQKSGKQLDAILPGAPDYYVRNGKYVHIYESKDILISIDAKQSPDFDFLTMELKLKLLENQKGKRKAVKQIVETIRKLLTGEVNYDPGFVAKKAEIFPILILHYRMFNSAGLNSTVNQWFKQELQIIENQSIDVSRVHNLIIIDIDTLIFNKAALQSGKIKLQDFLEEYEEKFLRFNLNHKKIETMEQLVERVQDSLVPFSHFMDSKVDRMRFPRGTRELLKKAYSLVEK